MPTMCDISSPLRTFRMRIYHVAVPVKECTIATATLWDQLQEFGQRCCIGLMQGRAHRHVDGFQIETPRFAAGVDDDAQQLVYFAVTSFWIVSAV